MSDYTVREVDLSVAHQLGGSSGLFTVENPSGRRVLVPDVPDTAFIRIGSGPADGDAIPLLGGFQDCLEGDERVYIQNPPGMGTLRVVFTDDPDLDPGDVGASAGSPIPTPQRLGGDLAPGEPIDPGEVLSGTAEVHPADVVRVRAQVSGTSGIEVENTVQASSGTHRQEADPDRPYIYMGLVDGSVVVVDAPDPGNTLGVNNELAASATGLGTVHSMAYDPQGEHLLLYGDNSAGDDTLAVVVSMSDPTSPSVEGSVSVQSIDTSGSQLSSADVYPTEQRLYVTVSGISTLYIVDYTSPANPTTSEEDFNSNMGPLAVDRGDGLLFLTFEGAGDHPELNVYGIAAAPDLPAFRDGVQSTMVLDGVSDSPTTVKVHPGEDLALLVTDSGQGVGLEVWSYQSPESLTQPFEHLYEDLDPITNREALTVDASRDLLWGCTRSFDATLYLWNLSDPSSPSLLTFLEPNDDVIADLIVLEGGGDPVAIDDDSGDAYRYEIAREAGVLHLQPLLSDGTPAASGPTVSVQLFDGVEERVDLDIEGAARVRVRLTGNGPSAGSIDFVEVASG